MTLVDTSSWVEALRVDGEEEVRERVRRLLLRGEAVLCHMVLLELWNGVRGAHEKRKLRKLEQGVPCLAMTDEVWQLARNLAIKCRDAGYTVPATDLLIVACARHHGSKLDHCDSHFDQIIEAAS